MNTETWTRPPYKLISSPQEVHLWAARLDQPEEVFTEVAATLSQDERDRFQRLIFEQHRRRSITARGILRNITSRYLGMPAASVSFQTTQDGKPHLRDGLSPDGLQFNLSHSHECAVYAITAGREIGVDVEQIRAIDADAIARRFFSPGECRALSMVPAEQKRESFFACWTRKEAYIKARGQGLGIPLRSFEVSLDADARLAWNEDPAEVQRWAMARFSIEPDYVGALVVEGQGWTLSKWTWAPLSRK